LNIYGYANYIGNPNRSFQGFGNPEKLMDCLPTAHNVLFVLLRIRPLRLGSKYLLKYQVASFFENAHTMHQGKCWKNNTFATHITNQYIITKTNIIPFKVAEHTSQ
jgi:hypothetical protein